MAAKVSKEERKARAYIRDFAKIAYPRWTGRKIRSCIQSSPLNCSSYWEGGSRDYFVFVNQKTLHKMEVPAQSINDRPIANIERVILPPGCICVKHTFFCGHDLGMTVIFSNQELYEAEVKRISNQLKSGEEYAQIQP